MSTASHYLQHLPVKATSPTSATTHGHIHHPRESPYDILYQWYHLLRAFPTQGSPTEDLQYHPIVPSALCPIFPLQHWGSLLLMSCASPRNGPAWVMVSVTHRWLTVIRVKDMNRMQLPDDEQNHLGPLSLLTVQ